MGRRLRCSSVAYQFRYAPSLRLPAAHFDRNPPGHASFGGLLCRSSVEDHSGYSPSSLRVSSQNTRRRRYASHGLGAIERNGGSRCAITIAKQWRQSRAQCLMGATDSDFLPSLAPFKTASAKIPNRCQKDRAVRRVNSEIVHGIYPSRGVRSNTAHHRQRSESSGSIEIDVASLSSLRGRRRARRGFACRIWTHFRACRRRRSRSLV
jgi:hypothetical protein